ncbi:MAG TPA: hypothetical protein VKB88_08020 [Bryobacteraceae bacterium]|nr:hypothetical protein [Bryobacteraceae bacterium]
MKAAQAILTFVMAGLLAGCVVGAKPSANNIPPPPQPAAKPEPAAAPPQPLSIPQTQIELPPPQPVSAEAAAAAQPPDEIAEPPAAPPRGSPGTRRTTVSPPSNAPKPETPTPVTPPPTNPPVPAADNNPRIQEIVPASETRRLQDLAEQRKKEIRQLLDQAATRRLNRREAGLRRTIESFLKLSDQAEANGDMRQAADYADKALSLAKDLQSGK